MNNSPIVVLLGASPERQAFAASVLENIATLTIGTTVAASAALSPSIILVDLAPADLAGALRIIEDVHATMPGMPLVALATKKDPDLILRAMRAGAREFAVLGDGFELETIITTLAQRASAERPGGKIISMFPAKGGMGATTLATNLAGGLRAENKRIIIVDFNKQLGDVLVFLDMTSTFTISEVIKNLHRLDRDLLLSSVAQHSSGLFVLAQAHSLEDVEAVTPTQIPQLLQMLARNFDFVVCDGLRGFDEHTVAVLDISDEIALLFSQDVPALKNAKHCLDVFDRLGYDQNKVSLVVNRFHKDAAIDMPAIAENLGRQASVTLANDYRAAIGAVNRGVLLTEAAPRSKLTQDIARLAMRVSGGTPQPRSFFQTLFGRGKVSPESVRNLPAANPAKQERSTS